ncbi:MAG: amidohydrolase family protein [Rhodospirillaceae bacterium]|nr:amidohydrolase family protein [Rhodospirillaceae bacterium]
MAIRERLILKGGRVLGHGADPHLPDIADVLVVDGRIAAIAPSLDAAGARVLDARGRLAMPDFVNAHYHSHDIFLKGCFEPAPAEYWVLNALPRNYPPRSAAEIRARTLLGAVECIRGGMTTVQDMVTLFPMTPDQVDAVEGAYAQSGLRSVLALQVADTGPLDTVPFWRETIPRELWPLAGGAPPSGPQVDLVDRVEAELAARIGRDPRITWAIAPSSPERCSREMLTRLAALAERLELPVYSHIYLSKAEAVNARRSFPGEGGSLLRLMQETGLLGPRTSLAHGVWLDDAEIALLAETGTGLVLNPVSNLKNKNGVAPIRSLIAAGVNLALGCDNCSCTDAQNMFQAMKAMCLLAAVSDPAPGPPDALAALDAATLGGARTAGLAQEIGSIAVGKRADLVLVDLADPVFVPLNSVPRQLVYGECGRSVETVIVDGAIVMESRVVTTVDEAALRAEVEGFAQAFRRDAAAVFARNERLLPYVLEADRRVWAENIGFGRYVGH